MLVGIGSPDDQKCNCCNSDLCLMSSKCMCKEIICKASIKHNDQIKFYFRFPVNNWKKHFYHYKMTLSNKKYANITALSKFY